MLLVVTSASDPDLPLLTACPSVAVVVPAHLSQSGWLYKVGASATARLVTSRGDTRADELSGVLTRTQRVWTSDLQHIHEDDREYVAAEMTAFLAALINELPCPLLNRPRANSLWGPSWTSEHWWRASTKEAFPVCCNYNQRCTDAASVVVVGTKTIYDKSPLPDSAVDLSLVLAARAEVSLLEARFCRVHRALQGVSLRPELNHNLLVEIEEHCALAGRLP
jgi:hypothetical protein